MNAREEILCSPTKKEDVRTKSTYIRTASLYIHYVLVVPLQCWYVSAKKYRQYSGNRHYYSLYYHWMFPCVPNDFIATIAGNRHYTGTCTTVSTNSPKRLRPCLSSGSARAPPPRIPRSPRRPPKPEPSPLPPLRRRQLLERVGSAGNARGLARSTPSRFRAPAGPAILQ